jgi:putative tryptophan/tyrosine transport system substrate-binding protein
VAVRCARAGHAQHWISEREVSRSGRNDILVSTSPFYLTRAKQIAMLVEQHRVPAIYVRREYVEAGGLMSYGYNVADNYRLVGTYAGRILKGEKPADLPVEQPTKYELVINLKAAKTIGLTIPPMLLARADEVIE